MRKEVNSKDIKIFKPPSDKNAGLVDYEVLVNHMWPLLEDYWRESRPPGFPDKVELNWQAMVEETYRGDMIIVQAIDKGRIVGFMIGTIRNWFLCRDAVGNIQAAYLKPEYRGARSALRMAQVLRRELLKGGAQHIFWDRVISRSPYVARQTQVPLKGSVD